MVTTNQHTSLLEEIRTDPLFSDTHHLGVPNFGDPLAFAADAETRLVRWLSDQTGPVVVQGDTSTALAGARAAHVLGIPVCHVEAGVRSFDDTQPWPEENFRVGITQLATWHYAASELNVQHLEAEGVHPSRIIRTGNPGLDRLVDLAGLLPRPKTQANRCLVTLHRREALGQYTGAPFTGTAGRTDRGHEKSGMVGIVRGLLDAARDNPHTEFLWPIHPNPAIKAALPSCEETTVNLILTSPLEHRDFITLLATSRAVLTDSGGVQEEAAFLGIPCVVARRVTDRPESLNSGHASLAGYDPDRIRTQLTAALRNGLRASPFLGFGDGHTAPRIVDHLTSLPSWWNQRETQ